MTSVFNRLVIEKDEMGRNIITEKYTRALSESHGEYETPSLNTKLHLNCSGFHDIRNLENYTLLAALWLQQNMIQKIQGLDTLVNLRHLYLNQNGIRNIEGLDKLVNLVHLGLAQNQITAIENLSALVCLEDLNLAQNKIAANVNLQGLHEVPWLVHLDLQNNNLDTAEGLLEVLQPMQTLRVIYLKGNGAPRLINSYRKVMIMQFPELRYLDDRPVPEVDRISAQAWSEGGREAEMQARRKYIEDTDAKLRQNFKCFRKYSKEAQAKRAEYAAVMESERAEERRQIAEQRAALLDKQEADTEAMIVELETREKMLDEPINTDAAITVELKNPVQYRDNNFDSWGQKLVDIKELETLLMENAFNFKKVAQVLGERHNEEYTVEHLREVWTNKEENDLESLD